MASYAESLGIDRRRHLRWMLAGAGPLALVLWILSGGTAFADRFGPPWESQVIVERTVVYSQPDRVSQPVGPLDKGAFVVVLGEAQGPDGAIWEKIPDGFVLASDVEEFHWAWTAEVTVSSVSVYARPYAASGVLRTAEKGDLLRVTGVCFDLAGDAGVWWATTVGYVPLGTIRWATSDWASWWKLPESSEAPSGWWATITEPASVRVAPNVDAPVVGILEAGMSVKVLAEEVGSPIEGNAKWYRIDGGRYAGGRIHSSVVRRLPNPSPNTTVPPGSDGTGSWIVVDRSASTLTFVREGKPYFTTYVSLGLAGVSTPAGTYTTFGKFVGDRMSSRHVSNPTHPYDLPNVPFTQYYRDGGYGIHGTYWHDGFRSAESQGCINMTWTDAAYLFDLTKPTMPAGANEVWDQGQGATEVVILD